MSITNTIHLRNVKGDLFGGVTAAVIALPMALTFGITSGAGAVAGLYGAIIIGFFAALFGGTPTLISEPTGPMTVVFTTIVADLLARDADNGMAMAFTVVMLAGVFQILFGFLKLGRYITQMPYTVISGFMSGIGIILMVLQLAPLLGYANPKGGVLGTLGQLPEFLLNIQVPELVLGGISIAILFFTPSRFKRIVPPQLLALIVGTVLSLFLFPGVDIRRIAEIPNALPSLNLPFFTAADLQLIVVDALVLAMLGCIDALLTSVVADSLTRTQHNSDKELVGQGIGNLMSGLLGGLPGAGATMGTVVNIQAGAQTALSGLARAGILLVVILGAANLTEPIPLAVLSGIAFKVGLDIVDWGFLKRAHRLSWKAAFILYGVIALTVFVDLIAAVGVGVFVANILTIERLTEIRSKEVKAITVADDEIRLTPQEKSLLNQAQGQVLLLQLSGPMIFGVAKTISREHAVIDQNKVLILDLQDVSHLGVTASLALENAIQEALDAKRQVLIVGAGGKVLQRLKKLKIWGQIPAENITYSREEALSRSLYFLGQTPELEADNLVDATITTGTPTTPTDFGPVTG